MHKGVFSILFISILALSIGLFFQNCASPLSSMDESALMESLPLAYDATVDTLAYMSCAGGSSSSSKKAIWSFAVGAVNSGSGIRLNNEYLNATKGFSNEQRALLLSESPRNSGASLQLSVRQALGYQNILSSSGSSAQMERDFSMVLGPLDELSLATKLVEASISGGSNRLNYFSGISGLSNRSLMGSIRFIASESEAASVRGQLSTSGILSLTYSESDSDSEYGARAPDPANKNKSVFGRGYQVNFTVANTSETEPRVLSGVNEVNLETGRASGIEIRPWICPNNLYFKVYSNCTSGCACQNDPSTTSNATLNLLRNFLKVEYWYINLSSKCIVQKEVAQQCYPSTAPTNSSYHYVSFCTRQ
ncbi:MAG: hypothetical protein K1X29_04425 [Bdellovibrionales bacterium]|nr:hypothetical protein [Bdellovibrionales bacterium]